MSGPTRSPEPGRERVPLTPEACAVAAAISPDDGRRLATYLDLLARWQKTINLVGSATLADPWRRHILDSAQLLPLLPPPAARLVDLGSGAGLPGLVLAILRPSLAVTLIDGDTRKCAFLREAIRSTDTTAAVVNARIESVSPFPVDVVTARALAPLPKLLGLAAPWLVLGGRGIFLKGRELDAELTAARESWNIVADVTPSRSDVSGRILTVHNVERHRGR